MPRIGRERAGGVLYCRGSAWERGVVMGLMVYNMGCSTILFTVYAPMEWAATARVVMNDEVEYVDLVEQCE